EDREPTADLEVAADAQRYALSRDARRDRGDADIKQLETEERPGDDPQPAGVVHGEGLARPHRLDDLQQSAEHDVAKGNADDAEDHDGAHAGGDALATCGRADVQRPPDPTRC